MGIIESVRKSLYNPEIRKKIVYTAFILIIYRFLANIPTPGVDKNALQNLFSQNQFLGLINVFSGGTFANFAIVSIGLAPYIMASVVVQLLTSAIPKLEELQQEGERGRRILLQISRIFSVVLAVGYAIGSYVVLKNQNVVNIKDPLSLITLIVTLTAGSVLLMWLGENLTEDGIGQGISLLIACNILSAIPHTVIQIFQAQSVDFITLLALIGMYILLVVVTVAVNEAVRNIPLSFTRRISGSSVSTSSASYLPIKLNTANVMPAIFAVAMLIFPLTIAKFLLTSKSAQLRDIAQSVTGFINNPIYYAILYFIFVFIFAFYYTYLIFVPEKVAQDLQKQGRFILGIRPGEQTARFISSILSKVTFIGATFLGIIVVLPIIFQNITSVNTLAIGGTGIIIVVGVFLQIMRQLRSYMITRSYESFVK